jgi:hypothetical protein
VIEILGPSPQGEKYGYRNAKSRRIRASHPPRQ